MFTFIEARAVTKDSIYGQAWEECEGTDDLTLEDFRELVSGWHAQEREDYGRVVSDYRLIETSDHFNDKVIAKYIVLSYGNPRFYAN